MTLRPIHFLCGFVAITFIIPSYWIVPGTGADGSLPVVLGLVALAWWLISKLLLVEHGLNTRNPMRLATLAMLWLIILCWTIGKTRLLTPLESTQSDRSLLVILAMVGIGLLAMDGLRNEREIFQLVRAIAGFASVMALVGIVQFLLRINLTEWIRVPGLVESDIAFSHIGSRSDFARPHGTTLHPIEFGVVSAALLPVSYWAWTSKSTWRWRLPMIALGLATMLSLSRSAILAALVVGVVMFLAVSWRERVNLLGLAMMFVVAAGLIVDGLVGTLIGLFAQADTDPSVQDRLDRFPRVLSLVSENPWLGRGFGTFNNEDGFLLDNEIQKWLLDCGLVGVLGLILFIFFAVGLAWRACARYAGETRLICAALAAVILGLFVSSYTFDAFFYRILTSMLYLSIGIVGALWRLAGDAASTPLRLVAVSDARMAPTARSTPSAQPPA